MNEGEMLQSMLSPHVQAIAEARVVGGDDKVVLVVIKATKRARQACKGLGVNVKVGGSAVAAVSRADLEWRFRASCDFVSARWCQTPAREDQIKIFLVHGGTALLTLTFVDGHVHVHAEPDDRLACDGAPS